MKKPGIRRGAKIIPFRHPRRIPMWKHYCSDQGIWYWFFAELPNGWTPAVCDDSQTFEPPRETRYKVFAAGNGTQVDGRESYPTFEQAKDEAMKLAMEQK